jgi:hypothetical protein
LQVLWNKQCLEAMLRLLSEQPPLLSGVDTAAVKDIRALTYQRVQEWITYALLYAPSTTQGLIQVHPNVHIYLSIPFLSCCLNYILGLTSAD